MGEPDISRSSLDLMKFPFKLRGGALLDVVGFGTNAVDHLVRVSQFPAFGSKVEITDYSTSAGGEAASTMAGLSRLGYRAAYAGRFGGDPEGNVGFDSLIEEGVDTDHAEVIADARTQVAFIVIDERTGERTIMWKRDERLEYSEADAPIAAAGLGRILHMTPHDTAACIWMARTAREQGVVVSLDVDNVFDGIDNLLPLVDICIASADLPERLLGITDPKTALVEIAERYGCPVIGLTLGHAGSIMYCGGEFIETIGFPVPGGCVDTTGAGDAFRTGFLYGLLAGKTVEDSALTANAVAALKCRRDGARAGLPDRKELITFLQPHGVS